MRGLWITWEFQRRNRGISRSLGWPLYEIDIKTSKLVRYVKSVIRTISAIRKETPDVIATQNPSILLATLNIFLKGIFGYKAIIDAHNSGIYPLEGRSKILMVVSRWLQRQADLTIVTNEALSLAVRSNGGRPFILPDKIPLVPQVECIPLKGKVNILYICTFSEDEPYREVLKAAKLAPKEVVIYFTGRHEGKIPEGEVPENVELLGFIPERMYWSMIKSVDIVMDLTLREGCLVCGAYEGIAGDKPLILSNTEALRNYFSKGCIYVLPNAKEIANGIVEAKDKIERLKKDIKQLKKDLNKKWQEQLEQLQRQIDVWR